MRFDRHDNDHGNDVFFGAVLMRLPPDVIGLGVEGMSFSRMHMGYCKGVWSPFDPDAEDDYDFFGDLYPPFLLD